MFSLVEVLHYIVRKGYVLRGLRPGGHAEIISKYAEGLTGPFGIALYPAKDPKWVYVAMAIGLAILSSSPTGPTC